MTPAKLKQLEKKDLMSEWQRNQQIERGSQHMFLPMKTFDPWERQRKEKQVVEKQIPALSNLQNVQWGTRFRTNRDINNILNNQRILTSSKQFNTK